jgi:hypothetical protein
MVHRKFVLIMLVVIAGAFVMSTLPYAQAASSVKVTFTYSGLGTLNWGTSVLTINGTTYAYNNLPKVFNSLKPNDVLIVTALKVTDLRGHNYTLSSWTDGNGLTGSSGTLIVPDTDTTVTANFAKITHQITVSINGLTNFSGDIITIDGTTYAYQNVDGQFNKDYYKPYWDEGTTHTIQVITPVTQTYPPATYAFASWTNGNGLVGASGTFTMPNSDVQLAANYVSATRSINFAVDGLSNFNDLVLRIDGTTYKRSDLSSTTFRWDAGTQHSVQALTPVKNSDTPQKTFVFSSWTNGNGLVTASGTFTTPTNDVTVTANYVIATHIVNFQTTGLSNFNNLLLTIDGTHYTYSDLGSTTSAGTTAQHIRASRPNSSKL